MLSRLTTVEQKSEEFGHMVFQNYVARRMTRESFALAAGVTVQVVHKVIHGHGHLVAREDLIKILRGFRIVGFTMYGLAPMHILVNQIRPQVETASVTVLLGRPFLIPRSARSLRQQATA